MKWCACQTLTSKRDDFIFFEMPCALDPNIWKTWKKLAKCYEHQTLTYKKDSNLKTCEMLWTPNPNIWKKWKKIRKCCWCQTLGSKLRDEKNC
jgi:hypothetical protein